MRVESSNNELLFSSSVAPNLLNDWIEHREVSSEGNTPHGCAVLPSRGDYPE